MNQLGDALEEKGGFSAGDISTLGQMEEDRLRLLLAFVKGRAEIKLLFHLTRPTAFTLPARTEPLAVDNFFTTREGLWLSDSFKERVLGAVGKGLLVVGQGNEVQLAYCDLAKPAKDAEIRSELPKYHVFEDLKVFLDYLASLLEAQWGGRGGHLLVVHSNIFYVRVNDEVLVVFPHWHADSRKWNLNAPLLHDFRWFAGLRAFSATAVT